MIEYIVLPLGEILKKEEYSKQKLEEAFKKFSCRRETDLENFLVHKAIPYDNTGFGKTYLLIDKCELKKGNFIILAYFTLALRSIDLSHLNKKAKRRVLGNYPGREGLNSISAYLVGQLGRCDNCAKEGLSGQQILNECYHTISLAAKVVGCNLLVLECREHMFGKFYSIYDFKKLYNELNEEKLYTLYKRVSFEEYWNT